MTAFSGSQQASLKGNRVAASLVKLAKKLGLGASELFDQVEFCVPHPYVFEPVHCALEPVSVETVHAASLETVFGIASSLCCFPAGLRRLCLCKYTCFGLCKGCFCSFVCLCPRAAVLLPFPAPVPVPRVRVAGAQVIPVPSPRSAETPLVLAPVSVSPVGIAAPSHCLSLSRLPG